MKQYKFFRCGTIGALETQVNEWIDKMTKSDPNFNVYNEDYKITPGGNVLMIVYEKSNDFTSDLS